MFVKKRQYSVIKENEKLDLIFSFKNFPILSSCVDSDKKDDIFADMNWGVDASGNIALIDLLDPKLIYDNYHTGGIVGETWKRHGQTFFNFIDSNKYQDVLEIGGSGGLFAKNFLSNGKTFKWNIIEPNSLPKVKDDKIFFIKGYFESYDFEDKKYDTIIHSHCFEHIYDPVDFLKKANRLLTLGGNQYISIPNMNFWLNSGFTNTLTFEHTFYCDFFVLQYLLNKTGFIVDDHIIQDHSIFVKAKKVNEIVDNTQDFEYVKTMFLKYIDILKTDVNDIVKTIEDKKIYLFGGHIFSQVLINLGLPEEQIICILDNDVNKQNKRLYGTNLIVRSPEILTEEDAIIVLRAGSYNQEIKNKILEINPSSIII